MEMAEPFYANSDEKLLSLALLKGPREMPRWSTFLELVKDRTGAHYCVLNLHPVGRPFGDGERLASRHISVERLEKTYLAHFEPAESLPGHDIPEGVPFSLTDVNERLTVSRRKRVSDFLALHNITDTLQLRISPKNGPDAVLSLSRTNGHFSTDAKRLLRDVASVMNAVLELYFDNERDRIAATMTAEAIRRLHFGWLTLDGAGNILDCDDLGSLILSNSGVLGSDARGRLIFNSTGLCREISLIVREMEGNLESRPRALILEREPWLDMLIVRNRTKALTMRSSVAAVAYVHSDNWDSADRHQQLGELFGLSPREAKLALAISRGMTLVESAQLYGWTEATARTYSRAIYGKTGARGQADLVRILLRSVLAISPEF